jgi:hypothetical protein
MPELDGDNAVITVPAPITEIKNALWQLTRDIQSFQSIMSFAGKEDRAAIELPRELVTSWLHIVFGLIYSSHTLDWFSHMTKAKSLMKDGMQKMIRGISSQNLLDEAVMLPTEVMSLITLNLLQDDVGKYDDICDTYSLYLNFLVRNSFEGEVYYVFLWLTSTIRIPTLLQNIPIGRTNIVSIWSSKK